jgi:ATP-dependent exoDNAse (exonuclease V) beta subunit
MKVEETLASDPLGTLGDDVIQELNLLYVALTRAKRCVQVNPETKEWIAGLDKFRATRNLAAQRANARKASFNDFLQRRPATG